MLYWGVRLALGLLFRLRLEGEAVPGGPVIVVCNHLTAFDPPTLGALMRRPAWYMAKEELFATPGFGWLIRQVHAYPVRRGRPDRRSLRTSLTVLRAGGMLILFPEGHRSETGELQELRRGAAYLARKTGCAIVPVGLVGKYRWRHLVTFQVGPAFTIPPELSLDEASAMIRTAIQRQIAVNHARHPASVAGTAEKV
ncbi:MAG: lysophospholipid acyltransferase family protein [Thermaerobacter sp.]|nr:lysophospholipid acyltransferase family protein [Thermaerobacter sp.]